MAEEKATSRESRAFPAELPPRVGEPFRSVLLEALEAWRPELGARLVSLVLFGSVARGEATSSSDIDLLVVAEGFPRSLAERRKPLLERWEKRRRLKSLPVVDWNLVTKSPREAEYHSPLYLDMVEDAIVLHDRGGFFSRILERMRVRMKELGSRRVFLEDGSWYWDLKPDYRYGEIVEI